MILLLPVFALLVISTTSPIISVLCLVIFSTLLSVILFQIGITFISLLYIVVYVGAVAILFIFVIITLDVREFEIIESGKNYTKHLPLSFIITYIGIICFNNNLSWSINELPFIINNYYFLENTSLQSLANGLYGYNALHLLISSLILLSAIIGPIYLCLLNSNKTN